jgi:hypothetical protein
MTGGVDSPNRRAARHAIRLGAMRLDMSITAERFSDEIFELIEAVKEMQLEALETTTPRPLGEDLDPPDPAEDDDDPDGDQHDDKKPPPDLSEPAAAPLRLQAADATNARPRPLLYDDKVRMRAEYDAAKEANGGRAPYGLVDKLWQKYGCTKSQANETVYRRGS